MAVTDLVDVVGVTFQNNGQIYYFTPGQHSLKPKQQVLVETTKGKEVGLIKFMTKLHLSKVTVPLKEILREATEAEILDKQSYADKVAATLKTCAAKVVEHGLSMKLVDASYSYDGKRLTFYFTAEGRVDFRELVKDLAKVFCTRIDLKQIGPRDESKLKNGMGICGRVLCCGSCLVRPNSPTIKMARNQQLSTRNTDKISGLCGRLKCCLEYEDETYEALQKNLIEIGSIVSYKGKEMKLIDYKLLKQNALLIEVVDGMNRYVEIPIADLVVVKPAVQSVENHS